MASNKSLLPTPLTPLAFAPGVKGALATLGAAEFTVMRINTYFNSSKNERAD
jgi:hypothetical protein